VKDPIARGKYGLVSSGDVMGTHLTRWEEKVCSVVM
jgi:hypothetical protein